MASSDTVQVWTVGMSSKDNEVNRRIRWNLKRSYLLYFCILPILMILNDDKIVIRSFKCCFIRNLIHKTGEKQWALFIFHVCIKKFLFRCIKSFRYNLRVLRWITTRIKIRIFPQVPYSYTVYYLLIGKKT